MGVATLTASACAPASMTPKMPQKRLAVTMDDFGLGFNKVLTPTQRNAAILAALAKHGHKAAGFVSGNLAVAGGERAALAQVVIQSWSDAGHLIGNHTWSHNNSSETDADIVKADILKNHDYLSQFPAYEKIFRFPYLAEGKEPEKIEIYRAFMREQGFQNAAVTIETYDWFVSERIETRITQNAAADLSGYRDYYVKTVVELAAFRHALALELGYSDLPHAMLMHHNILNGLYLDDVLTALAADGWSFVDARDVFAHPLYKLTPETPNRGRSVLSVLAQEKGIDVNLPKAYRGFGKSMMESLGL